VLYRNNGTGLFTSDSRSVSAADTSWATSASFGDLEGDGDVDAVLVIRKPTSPVVQEVRIFRNKNGAGLFERVAGAISGLPVNENVYDATLGDLDGDGDLDMIASTAPSLLDWILVNNGNGSFAAADVGVPTPLNKRWPVLFDATGDNVLDIAYSLPANSGTVTVLVR
jgi:large repetitive protein